MNLEYREPPTPQVMNGGAPVPPILANLIPNPSHPELWAMAWRPATSVWMQIGSRGQVIVTAAGRAALADFEAVAELYYASQTGGGRVDPSVSLRWIPAAPCGFKRREVKIVPQMPRERVVDWSVVDEEVLLEVVAAPAPVLPASADAEDGLTWRQRKSYL